MVTAAMKLKDAYSLEGKLFLYHYFLSGGRGVLDSVGGAVPRLAAPVG